MAAKTMMPILTGRIYSKISIANPYQNLRGMQIRVSKEAIGEYLPCFEDSSFHAHVPMRSCNITAISANEKKIYLCKPRALSGTITTETTRRACVGHSS